MASQYLLRPLRTLKEACRDVSVAHPEAGAKECRACGNHFLCIKSERTSSKPAQGSAFRPYVPRIDYVRPLLLTRG